jgi:hypothetical protein
VEIGAEFGHEECYRKHLVGVSCEQGSSLEGFENKKTVSKSKGLSSRK